MSTLTQWATESWITFRKWFFIRAFLCRGLGSETSLFFKLRCLNGDLDLILIKLLGLLEVIRRGFLVSGFNSWLSLIDILLQAPEGENRSYLWEVERLLQIRVLALSHLSQMLCEILVLEKLLALSPICNLLLFVGEVLVKRVNFRWLLPVCLLLILGIRNLWLWYALALHRLNPKT